MVSASPRSGVRGDVGGEVVIGRLLEEYPDGIKADGRTNRRAGELDEGDNERKQSPPVLPFQETFAGEHAWKGQKGQEAQDSKHLHSAGCCSVRCE